MMETNINRPKSIARRSILTRLRDHLGQVNIYEGEQSLSFNEQLVATRLYLGLIIVSIFVLLMFTASNAQTHRVTIISPSVSQFEFLFDLYPSTLYCLCSQVNIPYHAFLSFAPQYHQVCSSEFVSQSWISSLFSINTTNYFPLDFRTSASSQFQVITLICNTVIESVSDAIQDFATQQLITSRTLSRSAFDAQSAALTQHLQNAIISEVTRLDRFVSSSLSQNHLVSTLHTNYFIYSVPGSRFYTTISGAYLPRNYSLPIDPSIFCDCELTYECVAQSGFFNKWALEGPFYRFVPDTLPVFSVPGILAGCIPRYSIFQSTLECFYNSTCLNMIRMFIGDNSLRRPLDTTIQSRFKLNATVESMFNELLIETWNDTSNFTGYFYACNPASCSYTYTQRFNIVFMLITLFSLIGGLNGGVYFLAVFVVENIIRRARSVCGHRVHDRQYVLTETCEITRPSMRVQLANLVCKITRKVVALNLFKNSVLLPNDRDGRWSTRFYFVLLIIGIFILGIYSSVTPHTISVSVHNPSWSQFDQMNVQYSLTLSCPCTQLSMPYSSFMSIQIRLHQICSSDFIRDDRWLSYFFLIPLPHAIPSSGIYYTLDFRQSAGQSLFRLMQNLCQLANETVTNALMAFDNTQFVSVEPLSSENFESQTSSLVQQFEEQTLASFLALLSLVRSSIEDNHLYVSSVPNFAQSSFTVNGTWKLRYKPKQYNLDENTTCSCLTSNLCKRKQGFYCADPNCHLLQVQPKYTVPGLLVSCFPINSLLFSTLECLYNQACIQKLLDWRLFEIDQWFKPIILNISALDPRLPSRFSPNTTMNVIVSHLMVEEWTNTTNVTAHYNQCKPHICTYTYTKQLTILQVFAIILGLGGGLSLALRLLIPFVIKFIMQRRLMCPANEIGVQDHTTVTRGNHAPGRVGSYIARGYQAFLSFNVFNREMEISILATRIYLVVLNISFLIILLFAGLGQQIQSYVVTSPSEAIFETLYRQYGSQGFTCPCSRNSIAYDTFLSVSATYHQVCSSGFISPDWWTSVAGIGDTVALKDQPLLSAYFRMLASLCALASTTVNNSVSVFISSAFVSFVALTQNAFESHVESSLNTFLQQTPVTFLRTLVFTSETFRSNQIQNMFMTTWKIEFTTAAEDHMVATIPQSYNNDTCTCGALLAPTCSRPLVFIVNDSTTITLPGLVSGCLPVDGLRQSTLECFFDLLCLSMFGLLLNSSIIPRPLNSSLITRFPYMTTTLGAIIDQLFVEVWSNTSNYSSYYHACSPRECRYTFVERNNAVYIITTLLGFYGGLTISLRFIVVYTLLTYTKVRYWWTNRIQPTVPMHQNDQNEQ